MSFSSDKFKQLIAKKCETNTLNIFDSMIIQGQTIDEWFLSTRESGYGDQGVITCSTPYIHKKQIITPDDLDDTKKYLYKHVLNGCHLDNVYLRNSNNTIQEWNSLIIERISPSGLNTSEFPNSYNSLEEQNQYKHNTTHLEYIKIYNSEGFDPLLYGYLQWKIPGTQTPIIKKYILQEHDLSIFQSSFNYILLILNTTFTFIPIIHNANFDQIGDRKDIVVSDTHSNLNIVIDNSDIHGKLQIKPTALFTNTNEKIHIKVQIQNAVNGGKTYENEYNFSFQVVTACIALQPNNNNVWVGNSNYTNNIKLTLNTSSSIILKDSY